MVHSAPRGLARRAFTSQTLLNARRKKDRGEDRDCSYHEPAPVKEIQVRPGGSVHGERANFIGLVLGCIEASKQASQILQVNTLWKALAEIYTMHSFAPYSWNLVLMESQVFGKQLRNCYFIFQQNFANVSRMLLIFC